MKNSRSESAIWYLMAKGEVGDERVEQGGDTGRQRSITGVPRRDAHGQ
jgi:hypothetical protein